MSIFDEKILCSRFGWLVYYKVNLSLMLFNPFTSEIHKLPSLNLPYLSNVCFSAPPSSVDCTVVGFSLADKSCLYLHIVAGEQTWQRLPLDYGGVGVDPRSMRFPTFVGCDLYALFNNGEIYVLRNIVNGQQDYSWKKVVDDVGGRCGSQHFIVKSDQNLLLVSVSKFGEFVDVFKLNKYGKEWEKVDCLGRQMIYICSSTCVCVEAKIPEMENKIYFPRFGSKNGDIVFYSLETRKYHTFKDKLIRQNLGMGIDHLNPHVWIEPSWSNQCV
ncbi:F-box/kelch-repeat protein At1g57790-like [Rutidosis leptorrhynchoides]|uniref:F-box/kelch-repeat protein At1g57790-like n=1 Tax=Rutidosis leptorrhynchoides TaxID=125765 RepID=UPI003A99C62F